MHRRAESQAHQRFKRVRIPPSIVPHGLKIGVPKILYILYIYIHTYSEIKRKSIKSALFLMKNVKLRVEM